MKRKSDEPLHTSYNSKKIKYEVIDLISVDEDSFDSSVGVLTNSVHILEEPLLDNQAISGERNTNDQEHHVKQPDILVELPNIKNYSNLDLKPDHLKKPLWVCSDGRIILEVFSTMYKRAVDFVVAVAEPLHRTHVIHEYLITPYSLYSAVSIGLTTSVILEQLDTLSKVELSPQVRLMITHSTQKYGKLKIVLEKGEYMIESDNYQLLMQLLQNNEIKDATLLIPAREDYRNDIDLLPDEIIQEIDKELVSYHVPCDDLSLLNEFNTLDFGDMDVEALISNVNGYFRILVDRMKVQKVQEICIKNDYPLLEEYDFHKDRNISNLNIIIKPTTMLRKYQEKCLSKVFGNGRSRSGIIALPCGAGKTLVGITAIATMKKPAIILCTSSVAVEQWKMQFLLWTTIRDSEITAFTSSSRSKYKNRNRKIGKIIISTYSMLSYSGERSEKSKQIVNYIKENSWGILVLDEVHVVPAKMFRKVFTIVRAHTKLGLTATLVREDGMIHDLNFLIGPKLYEANWLDLAKQGYIAKVQCIELWCKMTKEFYKEYLSLGKTNKSRLLYTMNPNKFRACQYLINMHEAQNDKIMVFSDDIFALKHYANKLKKPYIYGETSNTERLKIFNDFKYNSSVPTIFISKVGDNSIDLPEANVIIQISSMFGSRRQEAQRLGRILRPKSGNINMVSNEDKVDAYFYSLVSLDTREMFFSQKRQQFLVQQGYSFKVVEELPNMDQDSSLDYSTHDEQIQLLTSVLCANESEIVAERLENELLMSPTVGRRRRSTLSQLSGADDLHYMEYYG
eukprot:TRINITY_DN2810_c0_g1_i1.p1 TRINITY_DN2810_c0_g1~~TRINITY_DN2810_c0_g1_i1.p1  ORF type:complete len:794 (-),score=157.46 TRINITY_DN2810_c0_g1_i1:2238-4619(-)